jgi:hypothetical protein
LTFSWYYDDQRIARREWTLRFNWDYANALQDDVPFAPVLTVGYNSVNDIANGRRDKKYFFNLGLAFRTEARFRPSYTVSTFGGTKDGELSGAILSNMFDLDKYLKTRGEIKNIRKTGRDSENEIDMVFVEGGKFTMRCIKEPGDECCSFASDVTVGDFYIGKYEVTQKLWYRVMGGIPSSAVGADSPVNNVSWDDIQEFIRKLNSMTGKKYRLPTYEEWKYAAFGGNKRKGYKKYSGSDNIDDVAWYYENSDRPSGNWRIQPVGTKKPNELGIYDMTGNVCEFVSSSSAKYSSNSRRSSYNRYVILGGSYLWSAENCRVSFCSDWGSQPSDIIGFRLASDP